MIVGLICNCSGSEEQIRGLFHECELKDWLDIPVYKGNKAKEFVKQLAEQYPDTPQPKILANYLENNASYAIVCGYDSIVRWSDIAHGNLSARIEARTVTKAFANTKI